METIDPEARPSAEPFQNNVFPTAYKVWLDVAGDVDGRIKPRDAVASPVMVKFVAVVVAKVVRPEMDTFVAERFVVVTEVAVTEPPFAEEKVRLLLPRLFE